MNSSGAMVARPVLIMAGGTGGHIFPGLAVAAELIERGIPVVWLGAAAGLETQLVPNARIPLETLQIGGVRGKGALTLLLAPFRLTRAVIAAARILLRLRPRSVLSLGGSVAGPGGIAAWLQRIPLVVQEQNRIPGITNRFLARLARIVLAGFADAFPQVSNARWTGNPVRTAIAELPAPAQRFAERSDAPRLLVLGGSLGAQALNTRLPAAIASLGPELLPQIRHQCGVRHLTAARAAYADANVVASVDAFIDDMAATYAWADLVVCRAGALTLAELAAAGVGAVLVPFPHAVDDHQTCNAQSMVEAGAARLLPERDASVERIAAELRGLLGDRRVLLCMAEAARSLAKPDAAARIADACLEVAA